MKLGNKNTRPIISIDNTASKTVTSTQETRSFENLNSLEKSNAEMTTHDVETKKSYNASACTYTVYHKGSLIRHPAAAASSFTNPSTRPEESTLTQDHPTKSSSSIV